MFDVFLYLTKVLGLVLCVAAVVAVLLLVRPIQLKLMRQWSQQKLSAYGVLAACSCNVTNNQFDKIDFLCEIPKCLGTACAEIRYQARLFIDSLVRSFDQKNFSLMWSCGC